MAIKVGIVGARGLSTLDGFNSMPDVEVVALCDLNEAFLLEQAAKHGIPRTYRVYEDMLDSDIDVVVVASPMQLHVPQSIAALQAGKHVLSEVTAGVTMDELWWLKEAVEKTGKVYMLAENYCYIPQNQLILNLVKKGFFGEVYFGEGEYLHDLRNLTGTYSRFGSQGKTTTTWRNYWQLGKRGAFYPTHSIGPVMQWFQGDRIKSVSCFGTGWHTDPSFRQEDTSITLCQLESGKLIKIRLDCISNRPHNMCYYTLQGTKGCFEAPRGLGDEHKIYLKSDQENSENVAWSPLSKYNDYLPQRYQDMIEEYKLSGHWGGDFIIVEDFINAVKGLEKPAIDVYDACEWTAVAMLYELSIMNGGKSIAMPNFRKSASYHDQIITL